MKNQIINGEIKKIINNKKRMMLLVKQVNQKLKN